MRSATLFSLLPLLATLPAISAHPHHHHKHDHYHDGDDDLELSSAANSGKRVTRKSLGFGPTHHHATYESFLPPGKSGNFSPLTARESREVAEELLRSLGQGGVEDENYYIRKDVSRLAISL